MILVYRDREPATTTHPKEEEEKKNNLHVCETAAPPPLKGSRLLCFPSPHRPPGYRESERETAYTIYISVHVYGVYVYVRVLSAQRREQAIAAENTDEFQS